MSGTGVHDVKLKKNQLEKFLIKKKIIKKVIFRRKMWGLLHNTFSFLKISLWALLH